MTWGRSVLTTLRLPHLRARVQLARDLRAFIRVHFLFTADRLGLLAALPSPATLEELVERLNIGRRDVFQTLLELGISLGEITRDGARYRLKGARSKTLGSDQREILEGVLEEAVLYDASVYRHLTDRLADAPLGDYLDEMATVVARASRVFEPFVREHLRRVVTSIRASHILDVGCGSGVYLHAVAGATPEATGVGIDVQDDVVEMALGNLERWGIADRFTVRRADIRDGTAALGGPFDLVLLINNIYYFSPEERPSLFRDLRAALSNQGSLVLVSMMHGSTVAALHLDLVLASTRGCYPLPHLDSLTSRLEQSGFGDVRTDRLIPREPFFAIWAR